MGSTSSISVGSDAEQLAEQYLQQRGLRPWQRNFRRRGGEIDLIMFDGQTLVFVEVRFRASTQFTAPSLTVNRAKQRKLVRTAALFIARHAAIANRTMRFDVVEVVGGGQPECRWIPDAFRPQDTRL